MDAPPTPHQAAGVTQQRNLRIRFSRHEIVMLLDALESLEEDYKYHGGLSLIEDEMQLHQRLRKILRSHDSPNPRPALAPAGDNP